MTSRARQLRHQSTIPERLLWSRLRAARLAGHKFRRQHPIDVYVVDFYCHAARLGVELDGMSHRGMGEADDARSAALKQAGIDVRRVTNDDVIHDLDAVCDYILREVTKRVDGSTPPHPGPLPGGEGERRPREEHA